MSINAGTAIGYLDLDTNKFSSALKTAQSQLKSFSDDSLTASQKFTNMGEGLKSIGSMLTTAVTIPLLGVGSAAATMAIDTDQSMSKVNSILKLSGKEWSDYEQTLKVGAKEVGLAYSDYAEAAYQAISAGVEQANVTAFLNNANKLAKGGLTDLTTATDLLTTAQNAYKLSQEDMTRVSDILIQTQNKGKTTVAELGANMGRVIPTASALGVGIDQLGASYAIMTANGISTAESTTYINSMLNELGKSGTTVDKVLKEVAGKSFKELIESGSSVGDVLQILNDYAKDSGLSLTDLFGSAEAGKAALSLLSGGAEEFNGMLDAMNNSAGSTDQAFKEMNSTLKEQLTQSFASFKNALSDLGGALAPVIEFIANIITKFSEWISYMAQTNPQILNIIVVLGGLLAAIGPVLIIIGQMSIGIGALIPIVTSLATAFKTNLIATVISLNTTLSTTIIPALTSFGSMLSGMVMSAISAVSTFLTGTLIPALTATAFSIGAVTVPVWAVIAVFAALVAAGVLVYKNWDTIKAKCTEIWQGSIKPTITNVTNAIKSVITTVWNSIKSTITTVTNSIKSTITTVWSSIKSSTSSVWNAIKSAISTVLSGIKSTVSSVTNSIKSVISTAWNSVKSVTSSVWNAIKSAISTVVNSIRSTISSVFSAISSTISSITSTWRNVLSTAWSNIKTTVSNGVNSVKSTISSVFSTIQSILVKPFQAAQSVISGILGGISNSISKVTSAIKSVVNLGRSMPVPNVDNEAQIADLYNDNNYSDVRFDYAQARQVTLSDTMAQSRSISESLNSFKNDLNRLSSVSSNKGNTFDNTYNINLNIDKMINSDNKSVEQIANELAFYIRRKKIALGGV